MLYTHKQLFSLVLLFSLPTVAMQKEDLVWEKDSSGKLVRVQKNSNDDVIKELKWLFDQKESKWQPTEQESVSQPLIQKQLAINPMTQTISLMSQFKNAQVAKATLEAEKAKLAEQEKKQQEELQNSVQELIRRKGVKQAAQVGANYSIERNKEEIKRLDNDNKLNEILSKEYEKEVEELNKAIALTPEKIKEEEAQKAAQKKKGWLW